PTGDGAVLPRGLRRLAGRDLAELAWRNRGSGLKEVVLPDAGTPARLICARPGTRLLITCDAESITALVLAGAAEDGVTRSERGDIIFPGPHMPNAPAVAGEEDCVCFVVTESAAKPAGPLGRMLHRVTGGGPAGLRRGSAAPALPEFRPNAPGPAGGVQPHRAPERRERAGFTLSFPARGQPSAI